MDDLITFLRQCLDADERWAEEGKSDFYVGDCAQRLLPDIVAKRLIIAAAERAFEVPADDWSNTDLRDEYRDVILPLLALPYADHPEFREEWKP